MEGLGLALDFNNISLSHLSSTTTPPTHLLTPNSPSIGLPGQQPCPDVCLLLILPAIFRVVKMGGLAWTRLMQRLSLTLTSPTPQPTDLLVHPSSHQLG